MIFTITAKYIPAYTAKKTLTYILMNNAWVQVNPEKLSAKISMFSNTTSTHQTQRNNIQQIQAFLKETVRPIILKGYKEGDVLVEQGLISKDASLPNTLQYSHVPLGMIVSGSIVVLKDGKGTKTLEQGDFIGLFETSDWLLTGHSRQIGEWVLYAHIDCKIAYFPSDVLTEVSSQAQTFREYITSLSRQDAVPQPITSLPLLDWVASHTTRKRLNDCAIVVHTHLLPNSEPFFRHLSHLVSAGQIFIMDKPYSTVPSVYKHLITSGYDITNVHLQAGIPYEYSVQRSTELLWKKVIELQKTKAFTKLLIVDDGGDLWTSIPWSSLHGVIIAGVEQTQRGIARVQHSTGKFPAIVSVASSGIKKQVESQFIGTAVVKKLREMGIVMNKVKIGILGVGSIGSAIRKTLKYEGINALVYDPAYHDSAKHGNNSIGSIDTLLNTCDLIIGTVGKDAVVGSALERVQGEKILASASSADVEFGSLLKIADPSREPLETQHVSVHNKLSFSILNGGYPINFDRIKDSTPDEDIVLTRCMLYIGAMQAALLLESNTQESGLYRLDITSQRHMIMKWVKDKNASNHLSSISESDIEPILSADTLVDAKLTKTVWK